MTAKASARPGLFCFGMGYCAEALATTLTKDGWRIAGTVREAGAKFGSGTIVTPFDRDHPLDGAAAKLSSFSHILVSIPPDPKGDPVLDCHRAEISALARAGGLRWVGYLSTTGVYGDHQGGWVDEATPTAPTSDRARARVAAEQSWLQLKQEAGVPAHIFRLAGIYGSGRSQLDSVMAGTARRIMKPGQVFSRIHVDDVAGILRASMERPRPGGVYNVCDDEAAPPEEVVAFAARLLDTPPPPEVAFDHADLSPMARSFYADNKRVRNTLLKTELDYILRYPTYREGLKAILARSNGP